MTTMTDQVVVRALRRAAVRATRAPSVHNTQPWRFVLSGQTLELHVDRDRQLRVLDPRGRQMLLSCGCALFNARVAIAARGLAPVVERFPDPASPDLLARIGVNGNSGEDADIGLAELDHAVDVRRTNRRRFDNTRVPPDLVDGLVDAAAREGSDVFVVTRPEHRITLAVLSQQADQIENGDPAYRAEVRAWTSTNPRRDDGVPSFAVPHVDGSSQDDLPIRDFDTSGTGSLPTHTRSSMNQCLLLLGALEDTPMAWLRSGEALERVLLTIAARGFTASPLTQVIEVARTNAQLREQLLMRMHPHVLIRVGRAPATPATRRRRLVDVLHEYV